MISRVVGRWVRTEAPRRAMLEPLVNRKDHNLSSAGEPSMVQKPREVGQSTRVVAAIPTVYLLHSACADGGGHCVGDIGTGATGTTLCGRAIDGCWHTLFLCCYKGFAC